jgi:hypothetical protein
MPQTTAMATKPKKKKGHAPAHQNAVAFHHNPKSKKTAHILSLPISGVCLKCKEKLEWRKQYRKYKPLTQHGKCNACNKRNVKAAYHTICSDCSMHCDKAVSLLREWNANRGEQVAVEPSETVAGNEGEQEEAMEEPMDMDAGEADIVDEELVADKEEPLMPPPSTTNNNTSSKNHKLPWTRVCAICVKEPALRDHDDEQGEDAATTNGKRLKLRELKTLERQAERTSQKPRRKRLTTTNDGTDNGDASDSDGDETNSDSDAADSDDEEDPFLLAVGGADKLAVGEAYQQLVLERQKQQADTTA